MMDIKVHYRVREPVPWMCQSKEPHLVVPSQENSAPNTDLVPGSLKHDH